MVLGKKLKPQEEWFLSEKWEKPVLPIFKMKMKKFKSI